MNNENIIDHVNILSSQDILDGKGFQPDTNDYSKIKEKFKNEDWVIAVNGEMAFSAQVSNIDSDHPEPFSFVNTADPDYFRLSTDEEITEAKRRLSPSVAELGLRAEAKREMAVDQETG